MSLLMSVIYYLFVFCEAEIKCSANFKERDKLMSKMVEFLLEMCALKYQSIWKHHVLVYADY